MALETSIIRYQSLPHLR